MFKKLLIANLQICFLISCNDQPIDRNRFKKEMEQREIVRLTEGQLVEKGLKLSSQIFDSTHVQFIKWINENSLSKANFKCTDFKPNIDTVLFKVPVLEIKIKYKFDSLSGQKIDEIYDAYLYNVNKNLPIEDNIQKLKSDSFLLTRPIIINDNKCLNCHVKFQIKANQKLAGMWYFNISRKDVITSYSK
ncbi:MAG: hypothetical protein SFY32_03370 [Bacteroidota bacterium]|nr:hypothetical protein [Bacteroidota bacterium]